MHQMFDPFSTPRHEPKVLTILMTPLYPPQHPLAATNSECMVRAICEDEDVMPTRYFESVRAFANMALDAGWKWRFRCKVHTILHPDDPRAALRRIP